MKFQRYLLLVLRFLWLVVVIVALAAAGTWVWVKRQPLVYSSRAVIEVEVEDAKVVNIQDIKQSNVRGLDALNTVVQSITSSDILLDVAKRIGRTDAWIDQSPTAGEPAAAVPPGSGALASDSTSSTPRPEPPKVLSQALKSALAGSVRGQLSVSLRRNTRLIDVVAEASDNLALKAKLEHLRKSPLDPEEKKKINWDKWQGAYEAQELANAVVTSFLDSHESDRKGETGRANTFLTKQAEELKVKLEKSEDELTKYRQTNQEVSVNERQNIVVERLTTLSAQVTDANTKSAAIAADLAVLDKVDANNVKEMLQLPSVASLPQVASLRTSLLSQEAEFAALKERYLELHPKYIAAVSQLEDLRGKLQGAIRDAAITLRQQYETFADTERNLKAMLEEQEKKALELDSVTAPYRALEAEVTADRKLYQDILSRLKETAVTGAEEEKSPFRVVEYALVNPAPVRPLRTKSMVMGTLLGLAVAIGLILLLDYLDSSIRAVDEAESELGLSVLAAVPEIDTSKLTKGGSVLTDSPGSSAAEAFRSMRASISLLGDAANRRVLLVTSAIPAEGKTLNSVNLAAALCGQGYRVLLIDADLRRPALTSSMLEQDDRKGEDYRGLTDVLSGLVTFESAVRETKIDNLYLLPAGRRAPNPAELLAQSKVPELLKTLTEYFDRIILDSAPINAVSDTLSLAPHADAVCLVLRFGKTPKRAIHRALKLLKNANARLAGVVMNRMPVRRGASYYYYYYGDPYVKDSVYGESQPGENGRRKKGRRRTQPESAPNPEPNPVPRQLGGTST